MKTMTTTKNIRRSLCAIVALWCLMLVPLTAAAQSMTDEQLVQYVLQEKEKGTEQSVILRNLLQRGVTQEQLRRVRKKVEAEQKQLGAVDLTGKTRTQSRTRLRTQKEVDADTRQKQNTRMVRSTRESDEERLKTRDQRMEELEAESGYFDLDSLDYYASLIPKDQQVWGRNIFSNKELTFEPNMNMATPTDYRIGAGDVAIIDVWGSSQQTFEETVSPDGTVTLEGIGPIKLGGLSVGEATARLRQRLGQYYSDCQVSLAIGETRTITVQVLGEVTAPGSYSMSSLASAFNALYAAGGITEVGTVRNIKVYRSGRTIATIDVYDYLMRGDMGANVRLQDNDVIIVGPYECLVEVRGKVKRPMFYEMRPTESVARLLQLAGGFTGDAYTEQVRLSRKAGREYSFHTIGEMEMNGFKLADGDSLYVDSVIPRYRNMVEVRGAVMHPGQFQMDGSIQSVRDLIRAADGLREDAFRERAVMHRQKADLSLEMVSVDVEGIIAGTAIDIPLRKGDVLYVPSVIEMQGERTLRINGEVNYPGTYEYADNTSVRDLILMAGGLTHDASLAKVDVFRRVYNPEAEQATTQLAEHFTFDLRDGFAVSDTTFTLRPFDEVQVRKSPVNYQQQNVKITGSVNFEGEYAMTSKEFRLSDLIRMAGGLSELAYSKGTRLIREMTAEERDQRESAMKSQQIALFEQSLELDKSYNLARADTILDMKMNLGNFYNVAINLDEALAAPGSIHDVILRANDQIVVPQYSNTIKVSGEVMYPISMNYKKGEPLSYYIKRAGGYSNKAGKKLTYAIYMNGAVEQLGRRDSGKHIEPGCEIVVPTKPRREGLSTAEIMILGTSMISISSMIISLINNLK